MRRHRAPRRSNKPAWKPLTISHDLMQRSQEVVDEEEESLIDDAQPISKVGGLVVFIETASSLIEPRPLGDYIMDCCSQNAAVIFFLKPTADEEADARQAMQMDQVHELPQGTYTVLGSKLTLKEGPFHGQRMIYIRTYDNTFSVLLWCSINRNWCHVASFQENQDTVTAYINNQDWNESATLLIESHTSQSAALCRIYTLGTRKDLHRNDLVTLQNRLDPFQRHLDAQVAPRPSLSTIAESDIQGTASHTVSTPYVHTPELHPTPLDPSYFNFRHANVNQNQYETPVQQMQPYHYTPAPLQYGPVPWYSLPSYGAVQWPHEMMMNPYYTPQYDPSWHYAPYGYYQPFQQPQIAEESPSLARTMIRNTVMQMPEQAKERAKQTEYRTVLHDPFRPENQTPLRAEAPPVKFASPAIVETPPTKYEQEPRTAIRIQSPLTTRTATMTQLHTEPDDTIQPQKSKVIRVLRPSDPDQYSRQNFNGPFFTDDVLSSNFANLLKTTPPSKNHDQAVNDWWWSGSAFSRHEDFHKTIMAVSKPEQKAGGNAGETLSASDSLKAATLSRALVPVLENLESYISGPVAKRRDYWTQWVPAPEWCCERTEEGAKSFFDDSWGHPPARIGRDSRYSTVARAMPQAGRPARGAHMAGSGRGRAR